MAYDPANIFAKILRGEVPAHKIHEDDTTIAILDVMPQSDGHSLVIPKAAAENLFDLEPAMAEAAIRVAQRVARAAMKAFRPAGVTLMQFNGAEAGQTVFHLHFHLLGGRPMHWPPG